jgi:uncharacterized lipoprotein YmbA
MVRPIRLGIAFLVVAILPLVLSGCAGSPSYRFYTLSSLTFPKPAPQVNQEARSTVVLIGPVAIPDYLDRPQIVTRNEEGGLVLHEYDQWGGSLKIDVQRVLLENLSVLLSQDNISPVTWRTTAANVYSVPLSLHRLDAMPGKAVSLEAQWAIIGRDRKSLEHTHQTEITAPLTGTDYKGIVAAMSTALADFSKDVAAAIKSVLDEDKKALPMAPGKPSQ